MWRWVWPWSATACSGRRAVARSRGSCTTTICRSAQQSSSGGSARRDREARRRGFQRGALARVVVAEDAEERSVETREHLERLRLRDVAGVDHALDTGAIQQLDDARHVRQVIVRVGDDADAHGSSGWGRSWGDRGPDGSRRSLALATRETGFGAAKLRRASCAVASYATFSRMWIAQALPRPITWVMPRRAFSTWRLPASPRRCVAIS